jgi:hypothetical protein
MDFWISDVSRAIVAAMTILPSAFHSGETVTQHFTINHSRSVGLADTSPITSSGMIAHRKQEFC